MDENYNVISSKIGNMKTAYPVLRDKPDDYVFSALVLKNSIYKNPSLNFDENVINDSIVDGVRDGGVDFLLNDPSSEESDMILGQSKYYSTISIDDIRDSIHKLVDLYKKLQNGDYSDINDTVKRRFLDVNAEVGDDSKIKFIFYTSAPRNRIRTNTVDRIVKDAFQNDDKYSVEILFGSDIVDEIKEAESRRPYIEKDLLIIDQAGNKLEYGDEAAIVNISAFSLKELYIKHGINLFSQNLRYFIRKKDIDTDINNTINNNPETFWYKNNGITIVCNDFEVSGRELKLKDFSIVNGGQTTHLINKNNSITRLDDFYLPCKIIKTQGTNNDERTQFNLDIAKATNSQKAIKAADLKSNAPEQVRFINEMREVGVFYKTKRGEEIPRDFKIDYKHADLASIGKLCLCAIFQLPATSRNKPSTMYQDSYYNTIFEKDQKSVSKIARDMLYADYYFRKKFIKAFDSKYEGNDLIPFAHNSRTICLSFIALLARINSRNIEANLFYELSQNYNKDKFYEEYVYRKMIDLNNFGSVIDLPNYNGNMDELDESLFELFENLVLEGYKIFRIAKESDPSLNETNYLKNDRNYFKILYLSWNDLISKAKEMSMFSNI